MNETFMKEKPVFPLLMSMALPMVLSMLVNSLYNIVDSFFVAKISEEAMMALSLVYPIQNLINAVGIGFGIGLNAVIAFYLGAGDRKKADKALTQGMTLAILHGIMMTVGSLLVMLPFLKMFTTSETVIRLGWEYSLIAFFFTIIVQIGLVYEKAFQAVGRMNASMISMLGGCIFNIVMDPVLIFGIGPFPKLEIRGAALATGLGQVVTLAIYLLLQERNPMSIHLEKEEWKPEGWMVQRLYSVGIPATLSLALPSILISVLNAILAVYSEVYIVVLGIYYKLQTFLYLPANGIIQGMRPLVGYNYGAKEYKRVDRLYWIVLGLSGGIMAAGTLICHAIPENLMGMFTTSPETVKAGAQALRIISVGFLISAVSVTSSGALEGLGKGTPSLVISLCRYILIIIPVAYLLSRTMGAKGVWHAFWIEETLTAVIAFVVYRKNVRVRKLFI